MTATAPGRMTLKVTVLDNWQTSMMDVTPDQTVAGLKARVLSAGKIAATKHADYEVKFGGARVRDESRPLGSIGAKEGSAFIVLSKRRRAVR